MRLCSYHLNLCHYRRGGRAGHFDLHAEEVAFGRSAFSDTDAIVFEQPCVILKFALSFVVNGLRCGEAVKRMRRAPSDLLFCLREVSSCRTHNFVGAVHARSPLKQRLDGKGEKGRRLALRSGW